jgi:hypothetical protein
MTAFFKRNRLPGFHSVLLLASMIALSGCFKPQARSPEASDPAENAARESATFEVGEVRGRIEIGRQLEGFSIPLSRLFVFQVCVKDRRTQEIIKGHRFEVTGGSESQNVRSDNSGCLSWSETVEYDHLSEEQYIALERRVTARGMQSGARSLRFAINPWKLTEGSPAVVDLTRDRTPNDKTIPEAQMQAHSTRSEKASLWLSRISIENSPQAPAGGVLARHLRISIQPAVLLRNLHGQRVPQDLKEADLSASLELLAVTSAGGDQRRYVLSSARDLTVRREGDRYRLDFPVTLQTGTPTTRYQLGVRIASKGDLARLKPIEALYEIGTFDQLIGSTSLSAELKASSADGAFSLEKELNSENVTRVESETPGPRPSPSVSSGPPASGYSQPRAFEVSIIRVSILGVDTASESTTVRTMRYNATACLTDNFAGGRPAVNVEFTVETPNHRKLVLRTLREPGLEGCIRWEDSILHRFYESEHFILVPVAIRHESGRPGAPVFEERRQLALNPWDRFGFGRDMKEDTGFVTGVNQRPKVPSRLIADGFNFETVDLRDYEVDEFLNLKTKRRLQLRIPLRVQRHSNVFLGRNLPAEPLRDGIYAFRAALHIRLRNAAGELVEIIEPMRGGTRLVHVRGGELKIDGIFAVSDMRLFQARTTLVFEVLPVDERKLSADEITSKRYERGKIEDIIDQESGLTLPTYAGPMWIRAEGGGAAVRATDDLVNSDNESEIAQALRPLAGMRMATLLERADRLDQSYRERMRAETSLSKLLKDANLEYVPLQNEQVLFERDKALAANNKVIPARGAAEYLLGFLNREFPKRPRLWEPPYFRFPLKQPMTSRDLLDVVEGRKELDAAAAARLCVMLGHEFVGKLSPEGNLLSDAVRPSLWSDHCLYALNAAVGDPQGFRKVLMVERKIRVFEKDPVEFKGAKQMSFQMGAEVAFGRSKTDSFTYGWSPLGAIQSAMGVASKVPGLGLASAAYGALGVSAEFSRSNAKSVSESLSFGSGIYLNMAQIEIDMRIRNYETCMIVRLNRDFIESRKDVFRHTREGLNPQQVEKIITRGIMVCSGSQTRRPLQVRERYFTITHGFFDENFVDAADLRNHPWFLSLRGIRDYVTFMHFVAAKKSSASQVRESIDVADAPLDKISEAYKLYGGQTHSLPGVLALDPRFVQEIR